MFRGLDLLLCLGMFCGWWLLPCLFRFCDVMRFVCSLCDFVTYDCFVVCYLVCLRLFVLNCWGLLPVWLYGRVLTFGVLICGV